MEALRNQIQIYSVSTSRSPSGKAIETWGLEATRRAKVWVESHTKDEVNQEMQSLITYKIKMRYYDLTHDHLLIYDELALRPTTIIDPTNLKHELEVTAQEVTHPEGIVYAE